MSPALFFLQIAVALQGLLWFGTNFRVFSVTVKSAIGILIRIALNLWMVK